MQAMWRAQDYTWAGGQRINQALARRDLDALDALLGQNPGLLVRAFLFEDPQSPPDKWTRGGLAHAAVHLQWDAALPVLRKHGETFERLVSQEHSQGIPTQETPIGYAVVLGQVATVRQLLEWGCSANGTPGKPLGSLLVGRRNNDRRFVEIARTLADHGASLDALVDYTTTTHTGQEQVLSMSLLLWLVRNNQPWVVMEMLPTLPAGGGLQDTELHNMLIFSLFRGTTHAWPETTLDDDLVSNFALMDVLEARGMPALEPMALVDAVERQRAQHPPSDTSQRQARIIRHMLARRDYPRQTLMSVLDAFEHASHTKGTVAWRDGFVAELEGRILAQGMGGHPPSGHMPRL